MEFFTISSAQVYLTILFFKNRSALVFFLKYQGAFYDRFSLLASTIFMIW